MNSVKSFFTICCFIIVAGCSSWPSYPDLYDEDVFLVDGETITPSTKAEVLAGFYEDRDAWATKEPSHYKYIISNTTYFICGIGCGPNEVEVKNGQVLKVTFRGKREYGFSYGDVLPQKDWNRYSLDYHFSRAEAFLNSTEALVGDNWGDERFWFLIHYDEEMGFPKLIARNDPLDNHGQHVVRIGYFEVIE